MNFKTFAHWTLLGSFCGALPAFGAASDTYIAASVGKEEVAAALASRPKEDASYELQRFARQVASVWQTQGKVPGKVVFEDMFEAESIGGRWRPTAEGFAFRVEDGFGGSCAKVMPSPGYHVGLKLCASAYVPIEPNRPYAVLYDVRTPEGGYPLLLRVDYYDAEGKDLLRPVQYVSSVDATQPTEFHRNVAVAVKRPESARFMRLYFHLTPRYDKPGMVDNVRVVDLSDDVAALRSGEAAVRAEREAASEGEVLVYSDDNIVSSYPVLPLSAKMPGLAGARLSLREFPGEKTRATVVLWSKSSFDGVVVKFEPLVLAGDPSCALPPQSLSAKILKVHYQGATAPSGNAVLPDGMQALVPELLLNDDSLVVPDYGKNRNLVKFGTDDGEGRYVDINTAWCRGWCDPVPASAMPIHDAKGLRPFSLRAGLNKQLVLTLSVPDDARPGRYSGKVRFESAGRQIASLPVELEVLPLKLPKRAETIYSPEREYTMGLYVWGEVDKGNRAFISPLRRSREQLLGEYRTLVDFSVLDPGFVWMPKTVFDDEAFRAHLALVREAGFTTRQLHLAASGYVGNSTDAAELAAMQSRLKKAMETARLFGFDQVWFYGIDEQRGKALTAQLKAWAAARETGAKVWVSGYAEHIALVGGALDLINYADPVGTVNTADWHERGARVWKYNNPQSYCEDPDVMRRNYGLALWRRGFDGGCTYCNIGCSDCWNDLADFQRHKASGKSQFNSRALSIVYPTVDGVVPTAALAGLESAIKDVRVFSLFRRLAHEKKSAEASAWFEGLDFDNCDLAAVRRQVLDWIVKMNEMP